VGFFFASEPGQVKIVETIKRYLTFKIVGNI